MEKALALSGCSLYPAPAQPAAGKQGVRQARAVGVAEATSRPERSWQRGMPVAGVAGRTALMEYVG
jgi:hypothetical protein